MTTTLTTETMTDEQVIRDLKERGVEPDETFTAAAGADCGYYNAWKLADGRIAVESGNNGWTDCTVDYSRAEDLDPMSVLSDDDRSPLAVGTILGIDAVNAAKEGDPGPFRVMSSADYYGPTSEVAYATDEEFDTLADAQAWIDAQDGPVYLSHNQSSGPTYKIVSE